MPLNHNDQMTVLKDILSNHQTDCCGTIAECEQIERLVKSLMGNKQVRSHVKNVLPSIYHYGQAGKNSPNLDSHISSYQQQLSEWVDQLT
ncbi:ytzH-like family protein [Anoxybacillus sp. B7M1]|uniref:YtzH-like family protein n=1 Tax=unclassified Anoxybacillus TaxID=2639704 RepID=UPI0005CD2014|nr:MULTISPECIES: YtzH-like family protein [unclassified Anoxybacillus]ANB58479.1 ytzH-like family protein [Anoxybacillus sp. B2M1]ANB64799.1 ytzH-like family protein [Anoxybacillus sp. B7M1]